MPPSTTLATSLPDRDALRRLFEALLGDATEVPPLRCPQCRDTVLPARDRTAGQWVLGCCHHEVRDASRHACIDRWSTEVEPPPVEPVGARP